MLSLVLFFLLSSLKYASASFFGGGDNDGCSSNSYSGKDKGCILDNISLLGAGSSCGKKNECAKFDKYHQDGEKFFDKCIIPFITSLDPSSLTDEQCQLLITQFTVLQQFIVFGFDAYVKALEEGDVFLMFRIAYQNFKINGNNKCMIQLAKCKAESTKAFTSKCVKICGEIAVLKVEGSQKCPVYNPCIMPLFVLEPSVLLRCSVEVDILVFKFMCKQAEKTQGYSSAKSSDGLKKLCHLFEKLCSKPTEQSILVIKIIIVKITADIRSNTLDGSFKKYCDLLRQEKQQSNNRSCNLSSCFKYFFGTSEPCRT